MLYENCRTLPIHNFNEITLTGNLSFLIIDKGEHSEDELQQHWQEIIQEYETLAKDQKVISLYRIKGEIIYLKNNLYYLELAEVLHDNDVDVTEMIKPVSPDQLHALVSSTRNKLNLRMKQYETEEKQDIEHSPQAFEEAVAAAKGNGYLIDRYTLPVSEWIAITRQLEQRAKEYEKLANRSK